MGGLVKPDLESKSSLLSQQTRQICKDTVQFATQVGLGDLNLNTRYNIRQYGELINHFIRTNSKDYSQKHIHEWSEQYAVQEHSLIDAQSQDPQVQIVPPDKKNNDTFFTFFRLNDFKQSDQLGRFYFNFQPDKIIPATQQLIQLLKAKGVPCDFKVGDASRLEQNHRWGEYFNRSDKAILYFNPDQQSQVLETIKEFGMANSEMLEQNTLRFAHQILDDQGQPLLGIGFGEEPNEEATQKAVDDQDREDKFSFTTARSAFLLYLLRLHQDFGLTTGMDALFIRAAERFNIDPLNPAFNCDSPFSIIKKAGEKLSKSTIPIDINEPSTDGKNIKVLRTIEYQGARHTRRIVQIEGKDGFWIEIPLEPRPTTIVDKEFAGGEETVKRICYAGLVTNYLLRKQPNSTLQIPGFVFIPPSQTDPLGFLCSEYIEDIVKGGDTNSIVMPEDCSEEENVDTNILMAILNQHDTGLLNRLRRENGRLILIDFEATGDVCKGDQPFFVTNHDLETRDDEIVERYRDWFDLCSELTTNNLFETQAQLLMLAIEAGYREEEILMVSNDTITNLREIEKNILSKIKRKQEIRGAIERRKSDTVLAPTPILI